MGIACGATECRGQRVAVATMISAHNPMALESTSRTGGTAGVSADISGLRISSTDTLDPARSALVRTVRHADLVNWSPMVNER